MAGVPLRLQARVLLLNNSLEISGSLKQCALVRTHIRHSESSLHDSPVDAALTGVLVEALYRVKDDPGISVNVFAGLRWWYDGAVSADSRLKRSIPRRGRRHYVRARNSELLNELYVDIASERLQLLAGKQIVVWGETDIIRTADVINPLDLRYSLPGIDFWEEIKRGLWMVRLLYKTNLPGNLLAELLFIPGDFQYSRLPPEGTHFGPSPAETSLFPGQFPGYSHWMLEKMRRDAPGWSLNKNYEWGFRLRGALLNIDWTLFYFDTLSDTATADPAKSLRFAADYVREALRCRVTGAGTPSFPGYRVFRYKRYRVIGGTAQTYIEQLNSSVWRLEWFYEFGQHFNRTAGGAYGIPAIDEVRRDAFGFGLNYSDRFVLPYVTHRWCSDKQLEVSLTLFYEKIVRFDGDISVDPSRGHRRGNSHSAAIIWNIVQPLSHQIWTVIFAGSYNPNGMYFLLPMLSYAPGNHWRFETGAALFGDRSARARHPYGDKDALILRVRYEW